MQGRDCFPTNIYFHFPTYKQNPSFNLGTYHQDIFESPLHVGIAMELGAKVSLGLSRNLLNGERILKCNGYSSSSLFGQWSDPEIKVRCGMAGQKIGTQVLITPWSHPIFLRFFTLSYLFCSKQVAYLV